ncbi:YkgJ family cysteine cluster protein [Litoribacter ruber]|uniref:YkgJ family cysteine cluster protein n=1 Tax=Litoribacter ruber TaxID=702568 RepID=A0AAP2CJK5_9BACT|nr:MULTISPECIES: YkgJ family cysteine cluster protein [Litoribacter]MBS9525362.1 YkgJ family cysteine cluster protein [Litoribacter alkaliphilus]MBT0809748.1 YkgJ family cysteine cluster protein [Litoribacter ruber]
MNLREKALEVSRVFDLLSEDTGKFMAQSGVNCVIGCGKCCMNPKISASVLEFLPLAFDLYSKGLADKAMEKLENMGEEDFCLLFRQTNFLTNSGSCGDYQYRGMICRLFGASVRRDKHGMKQMITCKIIKEGQPEEFKALSEAINSGLPAPSASYYYSLLSDIDERLSEHFPVNTAIKKALDHVMTYSYYLENQEV